jgi:hypothetical protein
LDSFWNPVAATTKRKKRGITGGKGKMTNFSCVTYDTKGIAYTGG